MSFNPAVTNTGTASSGALQFTPGYMGSAPTARNMAPKLADFVSVMDFGADNTGASDSAAAFTAAFASAVGQNSTTPPAVWVPGGKYIVTSPVLVPDLCSLVGAGSQSCSLGRDTGSWASSSTFIVGVQPAAGSTAQVYVQIRGITIAGDSGVSAGLLIQGATQSEFADIQVTNCNGGSAVGVGGSGAGAWNGGWGVWVAGFPVYSPSGAAAGKSVYSTRNTFIDIWTSGCANGVNLDAVLGDPIASQKVTVANENRFFGGGDIGYAGIGFRNGSGQGVVAVGRSETPAQLDTLAFYNLQTVSSYLGCTADNPISTFQAPGTNVLGVPTGAYSPVGMWSQSLPVSLGQIVYTGRNLYFCTQAGTTGTGGPAGTGTNINDGTAYWTGVQVVSWQASTAVSLGKLVWNAGNTYVCVGAGTTAASGGPSTIGTNITDGMAKWNSVTPRPWTPSTRVSDTTSAPTVVQNGAYFYVCTTTGTTAGAGPSGNGVGISDGSGEWDSIGASWAPNVPVTAGELVSTGGSEKAFYICVTEGTTETAGPSGDGTSISDGGMGGATWTWVPPYGSWTANTWVVLNQVIYANGNNYRCSGNGQTSASGSGPTGTGSGIMDNSAHWTYISASTALQPPAWPASTAVTQYEFVSNFGATYVCLTAGTTGPQGQGPTGGGGPITDGTAAWSSVPYASLWSSGTTVVLNDVVSTVLGQYSCSAAGTTGSGGPTATGSSVSDGTASWFGEPATAWTTSQSVSVNQFVWANGNTYVCVKSGTTMATGTGPSGATSPITDGTAEWSWVAPNCWSPSTPVGVGATMWNAGNWYACITAGTTAAAGPSGTGTGITDGDAQWNHIGAWPTNTAFYFDCPSTGSGVFGIYAPGCYEIVNALDASVFQQLSIFGGVSSNTSGGSLNFLPYSFATGNVIVGATQDLAPGFTTAGAELKAIGEIDAVVASGPAAQFGLTTGSGTLVDFRVAGTVVGSISATTTSVSYNTTCDYRAKRIEGEYRGANEALAKLPVWAGRFAGERGPRQPMMLAHEIQAVAPEAVTGEKDAVDGEGRPVLQGADLSKLAPYLVAAIKESASRLERLERRLLGESPEERRTPRPPK